MRPIKNPAIARAFEAYPPKIRRKLMVLRELIFKTAAATDGVGVIEETLRRRLTRIGKNLLSATAGSAE